MEPRDLASNLEFWSGRARNGAAGEEPARRPSSFRRRSFGRPRFGRVSFRRRRLPQPSSGRSPVARRPRPSRGRARPIAAAVFLAGLTIACLVVGHRSHAPAFETASASVAVPSLAAASSNPPSVAPTSVAPMSVAPTSGAPAPAPTSTTSVPRNPDCRGLSPDRPEARCVIDAVDLHARLLAPGTVAAAYRRAAAADAAPKSGPPACARGVPDERTWSVAASPAAAAGRYRCRFERGRAAMWWTRGDVLVHAVARDGDLAGLFTWWRAHPSE